MKNEKLLRVLSITALIVIILTWLIRSSTYDGYNITLGLVSPVGIWDLFSAFGVATAYFWQAGLFILFVGGFYGVINKTGSLKLLVERIKKKFRGKEKWFLVISIALFMITSSLTGIYFPLFVFIPLFVAIILSIGYTKLSALLCTVGAIIIGNMSLIYNNLVNQSLYLTGFSNLWYKLALLALTLGLTTLYVWKTAQMKKGKREINESMLFLEEGLNKTTVKKRWPLMTTFIALFVLLVLGITPWYNMFGTEMFNKMYGSVMEFSIGNFTIFKNILGQTVLPFGQWGMVELLTLLALFSLFMAVAHKLTFRQTAQGFVRGVNKLLPTAIIIVIINIVVVFTLNSGFYTTVMNFLVNLTENMNIATMAFNTFIGSMLVVDNLYFANYIMTITSNLINNEASMPLLAFIGQTMYGSAMLIAPTSLLLLAGLSYIDVPYQEWMKYIWRLLLMLLAVIFIILFLSTLL